VNVHDVEVIDEAEPRRRHGVSAGAEIRDPMNPDRIDFGWPFQPLPIPNVPIEGHDLNAVSTRDQLATQVEHATLDTTDSWVELSRDLQNAHHPAGAGPANDHVITKEFPQDSRLPRNVPLSID
jgi:hypothetical protein